MKTMLVVDVSPVEMTLSTSFEVSIIPTFVIDSTSSNNIYPNLSFVRCFFMIVINSL